MFTKKNRPKKNWKDKGTEFAREFKKSLQRRRNEIYSTMSETKAAFAQPTIRSLKNVLYRYMEDHGYKYVHKLSQFVTNLNSRKNCSIELIPKNVKNSDPLSILYRKPQREVSSKLKLETEFASRSMTCRSGKVIRHS